MGWPSVSAIVTVSTDGDTLFWYERGRLWRCERLCRDSGFGPWTPVGDWTSGPRSGRVLDGIEKLRLVAPYGCGASVGSVQ